MLQCFIIVGIFCLFSVSMCKNKIHMVLFYNKIIYDKFIFFKIILESLGPTIPCLQRLYRASQTIEVQTLLQRSNIKKLQEGECFPLISFR